MLAIFEAIKYFQRILEGRSFTVLTDHRPLSFALEQKSVRFSPRLSRQLNFISRFDAKIVYTPGDESPVMDPLSRIDAITMATIFNSAQISAEQQKDDQFPHFRSKAKLKLHEVQAKVHRHNGAELGNFVTPGGRLYHVHLDIVKMPLHQGFKNCLTMIDRYTHWPQAVLIVNMSALTVAGAFYNGWISFFITPLIITTDQGAQFGGKLLAQLCKLVSAKYVHTSLYHPQSNSMVKHLHMTLKRIWFLARCFGSRESS
uniref:Integrase catalytic domain-containing protein n=1 Tax=Trichogramma kaykai TaxID=54128 RepID=A0ABD2W1R1_9HYME